MLADELLENAWTQCLTVQIKSNKKNGLQLHLQSWHYKRHAHITFQAEASGLQTDCSEEKSTNHSHHLFVSSLFNPIGWALRQQTTWQHRFSSSWSRPTGTKLRPTNVPLQWEMQNYHQQKGKLIQELPMGVNKVRHC
jgi:hypothetical protein